MSIRGFPDWQSGVQSATTQAVDDTAAIAAGTSKDYTLGPITSWPSLLVDLEVVTGGMTFEVLHLYTPGVHVPQLVDAYVVVAGQTARWVVPPLGQAVTIRIVADATSGVSYNLSVTQSGVQVGGPDPVTRGGTATWQSVTIPPSTDILKTIPFAAGGPTMFLVSPHAGSPNIACYVWTLTTAGTISAVIMGLNDNPTAERVMNGILPVTACGVRISNTSTTVTETVDVAVTIGGGGASG